MNILEENPKIIKIEEQIVKNRVFNLYNGCKIVYKRNTIFSNCVFNVNDGTINVLGMFHMEEEHPKIEDSYDLNIINSYFIYLNKNKTIIDSKFIEGFQCSSSLN